MSVQRTISGRFAKGSSGNPTGGSKRLRERRKPKTVEEFVLDTLREEVDVTTVGGQSRRLPKYVLVLNRIINDAINGKVAAQKLLLPFVVKLSLEPAATGGIDYREEVRRKLREMHERIEQERQFEAEKAKRNAADDGGEGDGTGGPLLA